VSTRRDAPPAGTGSLMRTYREPPALFVRGEGTLLFDADGRRYLDFLSGIAVVSLGHAHPEVAEAICTQARTLVHVSNLYANKLASEVAATIDRLIGGGEPAGGAVFFANSGAEANECAIKLARRAGGPGRFAVMSTMGSFHGRTLATLHATGQPAKHAPFTPLPEGFRHVPYDDLVAMEEALEADDVAAVLVEPIMGEAGVVEPSQAYLLAVRELCDRRGVLMMVDEVQTGLCRTGRWFGFEHFGLRAGGALPDVVTLAKALGNGFPVGACWARAEVAAAFSPGDHGSTFGGQPLAMAAAATTLRVMDSSRLCERARRVGDSLKAGLAELPGVVEVRGKGLLLGVGLEAPVAELAEEIALAEGLVVNAVRPDTLRIAPPLLVTEAEVEEALAILGSSIPRALEGAAR